MQAIDAFSPPSRRPRPRGDVRIGVEAHRFRKHSRKLLPSILSSLGHARPSCEATTVLRLEIQTNQRIYFQIVVHATDKYVDRPSDFSTVCGARTRGAVVPSGSPTPGDACFGYTRLQRPQGGPMYFEQFYLGCLSHASYIDRKSTRL